MNDDLVVLYEGKDVHVDYRNGRKGTVHLRLLKISEIGKYLDSVFDDHEALKMCVGSPEGFDPDELTDDSYGHLLAENYSLNFQRALALKKKETERAEQTGAGINQLYQGIAGVLQKFAPESPSPEATRKRKSSK